MDHWTQVVPAWNSGLLRMSRQISVDQKILEDFAEHKDKTIKEQVDQYYQTKVLDYTVKPFPGLLNFIGNDFDEMGQLDRALEIFDWALEIDPDYLRAHRNKGWVYRQQKDFAKAKASYKAALASLEKQKDTMEAERYKNQKASIERSLAKAEAGE